MIPLKRRIPTNRTTNAEFIRIPNNSKSVKAKSIKGTSPDEIKRAFQKVTANGFMPTLAIVFASVKQDLEAISKMFDNAGIVVFGATTNGEFTGEGITEKSVAVLLLDINRDYFTIQFSELSEHNYRQTTQSIAKKSP